MHSDKNSQETSSECDFATYDKLMKKLQIMSYPLVKINDFTIIHIKANVSACIIPNEHHAEEPTQSNSAGRRNDVNTWKEKRKQPLTDYKMACVEKP